MRKRLSWCEFCLQVCIAALLTLSPPIAAAETFYVAIDGDVANVGSIQRPFAAIMRAQKVSGQGDTVFIRGSTSRIQESQITRQESIWAHVIRLDKSGTECQRINDWFYEDERTVFDFSAVKPRGKRVRSFSMSDSWLHLRGIELIGVQVTIPTHTQSICFANVGSHNIYERQLSLHPHI